MKKKNKSLSTLGFKEMTQVQLHKITGGDVHHLSPSKNNGGGGGGVVIDGWFVWAFTH